MTLALHDDAETRALALVAVAHRAEEYARAAHASSTERAYRADLRDFAAFCARHGQGAFPAAPQIVALYVADLAGARSVATIRRRLVAIGRVHTLAGLESPAADARVRAIVQGIARTHGSAPRRKTALTAELLKDVLWHVGDGIRRPRGGELKALRDRALLLLVFAGGFRRSEVAALDLADLRFESRGLVVMLRRSKTDQLGTGREVAIPHLRTTALCPVRAVRAWITAADIVDGPLFRTFSLSGVLQAQRIDGRDVARLVQRVTRHAALDGDFAAHSLRAGFVTSGAARGVAEASLQNVTGHRSATILRGYVRRATLFDDAPLPRIMGET